MDQIFRASLCCLLILPLILSVFHKTESNSNIYGREWNFDRNLRWVNLVPNKNKSGFKKRNYFETKYQNSNLTVYTECCPSVEEIIAPKGGVSKDGRILELYRDENSTQNFHQISCKEKGRRCGHTLTGWVPYFRCIQKYTYTYALVREFSAPASHPWRLDYIRIRNGCSCERIK